MQTKPSTNALRIVVAGGSGFLGRALCRSLGAHGHDVTVLTRALPDASTRQASLGDVQVTEMGWNPDGTAGAWTTAVDGADVAVNLSGESIAARRWSAAQKTRIRDSRVNATKSLVAALGAARRQPRVLVSGSAVGYYGARGDEVVTESSAPGSDFLATVCQQWEAEARCATSHVARVALIRTGIVLDPADGALAKMLPPFRFFVGGPLGNGRQYMPWIHLEDWTGLVRWTIETDAASGPLNATAPAPATNAEFSRALGTALGRPSWLPAPPWRCVSCSARWPTRCSSQGSARFPSGRSRWASRFGIPSCSRRCAACFATSGSYPSHWCKRRRLAQPALPLNSPAAAALFQGPVEPSANQPALVCIGPGHVPSSIPTFRVE